MPRHDEIDPAASHLILDEVGPKHPAFTSRAYRVLLDENERLKAKCEQADILGTAWQEDLRKMERQAAVVEAARGMVKLTCEYCAL
jgi:hypothetical protein